MKITTKLILTIIIVSLLFMLAFEITYNRYLYDDKQEIEERIEILEEEIQKCQKNL